MNLNGISILFLYCFYALSTDFLKTEEKERQQKKGKYANVKQRKVKACTKLSDNLYSVSSTEQAHKLIKDFKTRNTIKFSCNKASKGFGGTGE